MRYIFITLLLVNLGYFAYGRFFRTPASPAVTASSAERADTIFLLSENSSNAADNRQLNRAIANPLRQGGPNAPTCLAVGPFEDIFSGQALVRQLRALDIKTELRAFDQATGQSDYRVIIPPADSLQDAFRKLRELKSRKIDSYVITQGEHALGISLGVFNDADAAEEMQAAREKEGYDVEVVKIPGFNREFWVFSGTGGNLDLDPGLWASLVSENGGLQRKQLPCPQPRPAAPAAAQP